MIQTTEMLLQGLSNYASPPNKLSRLVRQGVYIPIVKGLYETDCATNGYLLAGSIYGPSYLSFEFALSQHGLIPEGVRTFTSATFEKKKKKQYQTPFGAFSYQDIPSAAYPYGVLLTEEGGYSYAIASPEKALCDQLYKMQPIANFEELQQLLFSDLRIDPSEFAKLNADDIAFLASVYRSTNVRKLNRFLRRWKNEYRH